MVFLTTVFVFSSLSTVSTNAYFNNPPLNLNNNELLNSRAVKLARVLYPEEAKKTKIQGKVLVKITVNEMGKVTEANMIEGDPVFKEACEKAALASTLKPKIIDGKKVKYSGTLQYTFQMFA